MAKKTINNGESGLVVRTSINDNFTELYNENTSPTHTHTAGATTFTPAGGIVATDVQAALVEVQGNIGTTTASSVSVVPAGNISETDVQTALQGLDTRITNPSDSSKIIFTDVTGAEPVHTPGQMYYANGMFNLQDEYTDVTLQIGREMHMEVINNTGVTIPNGAAVRHDGVTANGDIQIALALADTFITSRILGIATHDIGNTSLGLITTRGQVGDIDTTGYPTGVPLYLSDTIAGTYTEVMPNIVSQVGGSLVSNALTGKISVLISNNIAVPTIIGIIAGQTGGTDAYPLTSTPTTINNYVIDSGVIILRDKLTGTLTVANQGIYRANFTTSITFPSLASTRSVTFELYNVTTSTIIFSYVKNIPRDATSDAISFNSPFNGDLNNVYAVRVLSPDNFTITIVSLSFDIESISLV